MLFTTEHADSSVRRSKFCELRPKHVKLFETLPHNVCVCMYHENVRMLIVSLKKFTGLPYNISDFSHRIVCDTGSEECMTLQCDHCEDKLIRFAPADIDAESPIKYSQWQRNEGSVEKLENNPRLCERHSLSCAANFSHSLFMYM